MEILGNMGDEAMGKKTKFLDQEFKVTLTGLAGLAAIKHELRIPYSTIKKYPLKTLIFLL